MQAGDPYSLQRIAVPGDEELPPLRQRKVILTDLICFRQVGVEVVLSVKDRLVLDCTGERHGCLDPEFHSLPVEHGERSRQAEADGANVRIRLRSDVVRGTGAENFR